MTGRVQYTNLYVPQIQFFVVRNTTKRELRTGARMQYIISAGGFRKAAATGNVVGMHVSIDHVADLHAGLLRDTEVRLDLLDRVAHGAQALTASTEHVRRGH